MTEMLYKARHLVENAFLHLKQWRGIATRYAKNTSSFVAAVQNPLHVSVGYRLMTTASKNEANK